MSKSELEEVSPKIIMGVGEGSGNLFVEGDYDSIVHLQGKLLELEKLRRDNRRLSKRIEELESLQDTISPLDYTCTSNK